MEYRIVTQSEGGNGSTNPFTKVTDTNMTFAAGTYEVRYGAKKNYDASPAATVTILEGRMLQVTIPQAEEQIGYSLTVSKSQLAWNDDTTLTFTLASGYSKLENFTVKAVYTGSENNAGNVNIKDNGDGTYTISNVTGDVNVTVEGVADITAPTTKIKVAENNWSSFLSSITFGHFFKNDQTVIITAEDVNTGSGLDKVYYYISDKEMQLNDIKALASTDWTEYKNAFTISGDGKYVIYAKAVDNKANTTYVCSQGIVLDTEAPVISGITDGETHYTDATFSVTDKYPDKVFVDDEEVTLTNGAYTILADNKSHTVKAVDKAGNETVCTITVNYGEFESRAAGYSGAYDGKAHGITVNVSNASDVKITYSTDGMNYSETNPQFTDKGTYTVYYKIEKDRCTTVTGSETVTINQRDISITADNQTVMWNVAIDQSKYTVSENGLAAGDSMSEITLTPSTTALTENGTITISNIKITNIAGADVTGNYSVKTQNGILKVTHNTGLVPIKIEAQKTKTAYVAGDTLNVDDITVTAYYSDNFSETVTDFTTNASTIDMSVIGGKTLTVSYEKNGETVTKDITINVSNAEEIISPEKVKQNSVKLDIHTAAGWKKNKFVVTWDKVNDADGYDIFAARCGEKMTSKSLVKTVQGQKSSATLSKIAGRKLSGKMTYKVIIKAYKVVNGKKKYIGTSGTYHVAGESNKTYTNAKKIKVTRKSVSLKKGKTSQIKATIVKQSSKKKLPDKWHGPSLRYISTNTSVATVTSKGKIMAKKKGSCSIYVKALNGVTTRVKVTVK